MEVIEGELWTLDQRDVRGRFPLEPLLRKVREVDAEHAPWLLWGADGSAKVQALDRSIRSRPPRPRLQSIEPERVIRVVADEHSWVDELWLRNASQSIEFGLFDSSYAFVCGASELIASIVAGLDGAKRGQANMLSPVSRAWSRMRDRRGGTRG